MRPELAAKSELAAKCRRQVATGACPNSVRARAPARGLVLMALLFMLMLLSISAVAAAESWSMKRQREREAELIWVGDQYRQAVESYWRATPGPRKALPARVEQLLNDDRFALPVHHLRRAYGDPLEDGRELEPLLRNNTLVGVHSTLQGTPVKQGGFPARYAGFAGAGSYDAWNFVFQPPALASLAPPPARR